MIAEIPNHDRPRERLVRNGAENLADHELLAILLRTGTQGRSVLDLARDVLKAFGDDLTRLAGASVSELCRVRGIGRAKAIELHAAFALARRFAERQAGERPLLRGPAEVADLLRERFRTETQERFLVLLLDAKHRLLGDVRQDPVTTGLLDRSQVHAREVFKVAIRESCARIVLAHNHPSGDPTPSAEDIACTRDLVAAGKLIGIEVMDHVILGRKTEGRLKDYLSFREEKLM
jgi:DNA repair protein RadC